jgi:predicted anti-sigma-YlaC factor YlaD
MGSMMLFLTHWPPTIAEEADLLRRGVIQHALTPEVRAREEARALRRDQERETEWACWALARRG